MATASKKTGSTSTASAAKKTPAAKPAAASKAAAKKTEAPAKKPAAKAVPKTTRKAAAPAASQAVPVSPEHRYHMIATAAYFLAEKRGFAGGYEMQDWITAEAQIDQQLKGGNS